MRTVNEEARRAKQIEIMEKCFDCYAENGLTGTGIKALAEKYKSDGEVQGVAGNSQQE